MMEAKLVCYSAKNLAPSTKRKLYRDLYGYVDISHKGKYRYKRNGLVHRIPCKKITDSVILTTRDRSKELIKLLKEHRAETWVFDVRIKNHL